MSQSTINQTALSQSAGNSERDTLRRPNRLEHRSLRGGFTLIELLVVIAIIGILAGIIVPAVMSAYRRAEEFAIESDVSQLSLALEAFKNKYGFYPPDFTGITTVDQFRPYLNRVAPNHSEEQYLNAWWTQVGQKLNQAGPQASYVFWLSGLAKNKQYPLTGNTGTPLSAYNVGAVEREIYFDFKSERLFDPFSSPPLPIGKSNSTVATYSQFSGNCQPFVYFEVKRLGSLPAPVNLSFYVNVNASDATYKLYPYYVVKSGKTVFFNKDSFQLIASGMDSQFADNRATPPQNSPDLTLNGLPPRERDNLTNFSEGRLEKIQPQ